MKAKAPGPRLLAPILVAAGLVVLPGCRDGCQGLNMESAPLDAPVAAPMGAPAAAAVPAVPMPAACAQMPATAQNLGGDGTYVIEKPGEGAAVTELNAPVLDAQIWHVATSTSVGKIRSKFPPAAGQGARGPGESLSASVVGMRVGEQRLAILDRDRLGKGTPATLPAGNLCLRVTLVSIDTPLSQAPGPTTTPTGPMTLSPAAPVSPGGSAPPPSSPPPPVVPPADAIDIAPGMKLLVRRSGDAAASTPEAFLVTAWAMKKGAPHQILHGKRFSRRELDGILHGALDRHLHGQNTYVLWIDRNLAQSLLGDSSLPPLVQIIPAGE